MREGCFASLELLKQFLYNHARILCWLGRLFFSLIIKPILSLQMLRALGKSKLKAAGKEPSPLQLKTEENESRFWGSTNKQVLVATKGKLPTCC